MKPEVFLKNVDLVSEASNGIESLRAYIFQLAIEGKLVEQIPNEESAEILLSTIKSEKEKLIKKGDLKKSKNEFGTITSVEILPKGWALTCLAELGLVNPRNSLADGLEVSFIPMKLIPEGFSGVAKSEVEKWKQVKIGFTHIASNDVVMAKITPCFQNRKSVVLKDLKNGFGAGTTELHVFRAVPNTIIPEYVLLFLKSANFINRGIPKMTGSAGQKRVPNDYFSFTPIPLPPREEQKRIVAKVNQLMVLCDELEAKQEKQTQTRRQLNDASLNALLSAASPDEFEKHWQRIVDNFDIFYDDLDNLQSIRQAILQLAVKGKLIPRNPNSNSKDFILSVRKKRLKLLRNEKKLEKTEFKPITEKEQPFQLPNGWEFLKMDEISLKLGAGSTPIGGRKVYEKSGIKFLRSQNVWNDGLYLTDVAYISERTHEDMEGTWVKPEDILLNITGASIGRSCIVPDDFDTANVSQHVAIVRLVEPEFRWFLHLFIISPIFQKNINDVEVGVSREGLSMGKLKQFVIPVPPLEEQKRIVAKVDQLMALCDELEKKLVAKSSHLEKLTQSILSSSSSLGEDTSLKPAEVNVGISNEPFIRISKPSFGERFKNGNVPLSTLRPAAGGFSDDQTVESMEWVQINTQQVLNNKMFVAQVSGRSMQPLIPDGAYCLFEKTFTGAKPGEVVIVECHEINDPETGGSYTIKRFQPTKRKNEDGVWETTEIRLSPENPEFSPIVLSAKAEADFKIRAKFREVLK